MTTSGAIWWNELQTSDEKAAIGFYTELIGWRTFQLSGLDSLKPADQAQPVYTVDEGLEPVRHDGSTARWTSCAWRGCRSSRSMTWTPARSGSGGGRILGRRSTWRIPAVRCAARSQGGARHRQAADYDNGRTLSWPPVFREMEAFADSGVPVNTAENWLFLCFIQNRAGRVRFPVFCRSGFQRRFARGYAFSPPSRHSRQKCVKSAQLTECAKSNKLPMPAKQGAKSFVYI
jgi:predicted enzyme related to lactoylglutathione lyase